MQRSSVSSPQSLILQQSLLLRKHMPTVAISSSWLCSSPTHWASLWRWFKRVMPIYQHETRSAGIGIVWGSIFCDWGFSISDRKQHTKKQKLGLGPVFYGLEFIVPAAPLVDRIFLSWKENGWASSSIGWQTQKLCILCNFCKTLLYFI